MRKETMKLVRRSTVAASLAALALVGGAGCTTSTAGNPTQGAQVSTTAPTGANTTKPTTKRPTTTAADSPLAKVEPCELVTASAKDALKITAPGSAEKIGKSRACLWTIPGNTIKDQASLSVALFDTLGIKDIVAKGPVETIPRIGQHEARKWEGKSVEGCVISLEVGPSTRVDVIGTSISPEKACEVATTAAALVEAELP